MPCQKSARGRVGNINPAPKNEHTHLPCTTPTLALWGVFVNRLKTGVKTGVYAWRGLWMRSNGVI